MSAPSTCSTTEGNDDQVLPLQPTAPPSTQEEEDPTTSIVCSTAEEKRQHELPILPLGNLDVGDQEEVAATVSAQLEEKASKSSLRTEASSDEVKTDEDLCLSIMTSSDSLLRDGVSRSRSVTPTPAISIEPDVGLEWTAHMLCTPESEVVTSDTFMAKARGSNTTTSSSVMFPSDDESVDGDLVFGDDTADEGGEEGGEADGEGGNLADTKLTQSSEQLPEQVASPPAETDNVSDL